MIIIDGHLFAFDPSNHAARELPNLLAPVRVHGADHMRIYANIDGGAQTMRPAVQM